MYLSSCSRDENVTFELILKAEVATTGSTTFGEIKYYDGMVTQSILNSTKSFSKTIPLVGYQSIYFGVFGGITGAGSTVQPSFNISYEVDRIFTSGSRDILCSGSTGQAIFKNNVWSFNFLADRIFDGVGCQ